MSDPETRDGGDVIAPPLRDDIAALAAHTETDPVAEMGRRILLARLRELRGRRLAMGREPDDERNAAADMCCCDRDGPEGWVRAPQFRDGCPLHPLPVELSRHAADDWPAGTRRSRNAAVIAFARETWPNDGAEGETVHFLCDELERAMGSRPTGYDGSTGAEFLEAATEALGGGLDPSALFADLEGDEG